MKKLLLLSAALAASGLAMAQDVGRVISSTPVMQQVGVPRQVCTTEAVALQQPKTGAGAAIGAIAGGAVGSTMGRGPGQAAATVIGAIGGAVIGDRIESAPPAQVQNVQRCGMQTFFENRAVGYNVVYEFAGKQYAVQMPNDPGPTIQLQVAPMGSASTQMAAPTSPLVTPQPVYVQQQPTVIVAPPVYPGYYGYPYYPPIGVQLGFGYWGGYRGHRHWH